MSDPHAPRRVSATIKHPESAKYKGDNPWLVFEGSVEAVREQVIEAFGMENVDGMTLHEVVSEAQDMFSAMSTAKGGLGGKVLSKGEGNAWSQAKSQPKEEAKSEKSEEETERERLLHEIGKAESRDALRDLWARNQEAFKDESLMDAYKARGKELPA